MKLYREVKASERLPTGIGVYYTSAGHCTLTTHGEWAKRKERIGIIQVYPDWWLEPIEITEDEIGEIAKAKFPDVDDFSDEEWADNDRDKAIFSIGAKALLSKLKGDEL